MPSFKEILKYAIKNLIDELNRLILIIILILCIISIFVSNFYIDLSKVLLLIIFIIRVTSKDKIKRKKENELYLKIKNKIFHPFKIENNIYKKCPKCHTILKLPLPKKRGINHAKCPNCNNRLTIFNIRKQKQEKIEVEVIKKKRG